MLNNMTQHAEIKTNLLYNSGNLNNTFGWCHTTLSNSIYDCSIHLQNHLIGSDQKHTIHSV